MKLLTPFLAAFVLTPAYGYDVVKPKQCETLSVPSTCYKDAKIKQNYDCSKKAWQMECNVIPRKIKVPCPDVDCSETLTEKVCKDTVKVEMQPCEKTVQQDALVPCVQEKSKQVCRLENVSVDATCQRPVKVPTRVACTKTKKEMRCAKVPKIAQCEKDGTKKQLATCTQKKEFCSVEMVEEPATCQRTTFVEEKYDCSTTKSKVTCSKDMTVTVPALTKMAKSGKLGYLDVNDLHNQNTTTLKEKEILTKAMISNNLANKDLGKSLTKDCYEEPYVEQKICIRKKPVVESYSCTKSVPKKSCAIRDVPSKCLETVETKVPYPCKKLVEECKEVAVPYQSVCDSEKIEHESYSCKKTELQKKCSMEPVNKPTLCKETQMVTKSKMCPMKQVVQSCHDVPRKIPKMCPPDQEICENVVNETVCKKVEKIIKETCSKWVLVKKPYPCNKISKHCEVSYLRKPSAKHSKHALPTLPVPSPVVLKDTFPTQLPSASLENILTPVQASSWQVPDLLGQIPNKLNEIELPSKLM